MGKFIFKYIRKLITNCALVGLMLGAGWFVTAEMLPMAPTEPDRWLARVCNAKDSGATQVQTAAWLAKQYKVEKRASVQYTAKIWPKC